MIGEHLGHFRITAKLGEGGMGEVYRAEDGKLGREVAVKVLPQVFAADADRMARFAREARVLASLNHPAIAGIHEVGEDGDVHYLVMELVEGETLAERIARGRLEPEEALPIALAIAEALEAAHGRGIVHRDLKPANVKIEPGGAVKVLDFGLAKALEPTAGSPGATGLANSPTLTYQATQAGVLMGTAAYMSPEQARGQEADRRVDVWALGVVLFEMLTGRMAFQGETISDTLASVLKTETDWSQLPPDVHPEIRRLLERCLEKDPDRRLHDIADARVVLADAVAGRLEEPAAIGSGAETPAARPSWGGFAAAALAGAVLAALAVWLALPPPPAPPLRKSELAVPDAGALARSHVGPAISPDARWVAYGSGGRLWLRDLQGLESSEVPDSEGADRPFWSPDSRWLAFGVGDRLVKFPVGGAGTAVVAKLPGPLDTVGGGGWMPDGRIVLASGDKGLFEVSDQGGDPRVLLVPGEGEQDFHFAAPLPDGRGVIFVIHRSEGIDTIELFAEGKRTQLLQLPGERLGTPVYSSSGHVLYERATTVPGVWALPFSLDDLEVTGEPFLVAANASVPDVARDGTLVYVLGSDAALSRLAWVDRTGQRLGEILGPVDQVPHPVLSPDGRRLVLMITEGGQRDLWLHDLERDTRTRLTFDEATESWPEWSPDGSEIVYQSDTESGPRGLFVKAADGTGSPRLVLERPGDATGPTFTADGRGIVYSEQGEGTSWDLWLLPSLEAEPTALIQEEGPQYIGRVAPSGEYMAYISVETGRPEVYLTRFPAATGKWQVSVDGGEWFHWNADGSRLYFIRPGDQAIMEVEVTTAPTLTLGRPRQLFVAVPSGARGASFSDGFAVAPDGERFVIVEADEGNTEVRGITVVQSWFEEFRP